MSFSIALAVWGPIEGSVMAWLGLNIGAWTCAIGVVTVLATIPILRTTGSVAFAGHWLAAQMYFIVFACSLDVGGLFSSAVAWNAAVPVFATIVAGRRAGVIWCGLVVVQLAGLGIAGESGLIPPSKLAADARTLYDLAILVGVAAMLTSLAWLYESEKDFALDAVAKEAKRAQRAHDQGRRILDNVSEGLAILGADGELLHERSAVFDTWFGRADDGERVWSRLRSHDADFASALELGWDQLHAGVLPVDVALEQLPTELRTSEQTLRVEYHPIGSSDALEQVLVTITDISVELEATQAKRSHEDTMALVGRFARDAHGCREFIRDTTGAMRHVRQGQAGSALLRTLHTVKGNAATLDLTRFARLVHESEEQLEFGAPPREVTAPLLDHWASIESVVGPLVGDPDQLALSRRRLHGWIRALSSGDTRGVREALQAELLEPAQVRLKRLADGARELAVRLDKRNVQVRVLEGDVLVDPSAWTERWAALTHLIRNAVDHGLETAQERRDAGKPAKAQLRLSAFTTDEGVVVEVSDDGRGIDWERVRARAEQRGLLLSPHDALFADGLSTRDDVSEVSGRGVGLAAVKAAFEASGGRIDVISELGRGTTFRCVCPIAANTAPGECATLTGGRRAAG